MPSIDREAHSGDILDDVSRRKFLKVMGASFALLGMSGCRWPEEEIVPFAHRPENVTPGVPRQFTTTMEIGGVGVPLLVTSFDGRPIKVDGNPEHPESLGGSDAVSQASVLEFYDPDRSRSPFHRDARQQGVRTWAKFTEFAQVHFAKLREQGGEGLRVLSEASSSETLAGLRREMTAAFPRAMWHEYEPFSRDQEREGIAQVAGRPLRVHIRLDLAEVILCLDDDILGDHPAAVRQTREFAGGRRAENGKMNRLYVVESTHTVTGGMADHRHPARPSEVGDFAADLAGVLLSRAPAKDPLVARVAADLLAHRSRSVITAGPAQPPAVHSLVYRMNAALDNANMTVIYREDQARPSHVESIRGLTSEMRDGRVDTLLILGGNPVFTAPADLTFGEALESVGTSIHLSLFRDETSAGSTWHLNRAHYLEAWGDARAIDGLLSVTQPLIAPLYGGRTPIELLALLLGDPAPKGYDLVRGTLRGILGEAGFEKRWRRALHDGFLSLSAPAVFNPEVDTSASPELAPHPSQGYEVVFRPHPHVRDGRFANNAWLQETAVPIARLTWDNAALLSVADAEELRVGDGDHVAITAANRRIEIPAYVVPGQAEGSVTLWAGYGRRRGGRVADGAGTDVYPLRTADHPYVAYGAKIERTGGRTELATLQALHVDDALGKRVVEERMGLLIREATLEKYLEDPGFARHAVEHPKAVSLWEEWDYPGRAWAMSIDLSVCTGCNACVVACNAENNIPVVGKDQVLLGREMHWLRVDRYFGGDPANPKVAHQPVPCLQCENAPCESVCPVTATAHTSEGLNDQVYNRCIGTRYCANNCPVKVRKFNFFDYVGKQTDIEKMVVNPEVTQRVRGVTEKCTYCVQRISAARIAAKREGRPIGDGEIVPACAQSCPAQAIVFGDLSDPESRVTKLHESPRTYGILEELNLLPRTRYMARLRNPGPREG